MKPLQQLGLDDPCACGNGKRYRDCHQRIVDAPEGEMLAIAEAALGSGIRRPRQLRRYRMTEIGASSTFRL
ncbi:hypothetical protein [Aurantiacibacter xanthus]|uniref:hypothetical protein n=1 Tax=Aurantiacibacter xanthus TaxID=1784712 RepID=UPI0011C238DE|nr:hypothetical protein [Aurantiacibacter xanthus]